MKTRLFTILTALFIALTFTTSSRAQALRYKGSVNDVRYSPDGTKIAVAWTNGIWLYDALTGEELENFSSQTAMVNSIAFSPDGKILTSADWNKVHLWDANTGIKLRILSGHKDIINSIAFSPDGKTIASAGWEKTVHLWDADTGKHVRTLKEHKGMVYSVAFSPDGKTIASAGWGGVHLWNTSTGHRLRTLDQRTIVKTGTTTFTSVAFSPDGKHIIIGSGGSNATICLWNVDTGRYLRMIHRVRPRLSVLSRRDFLSDNLTLIRDTTFDTNVVFSPDGKMIASAGWGGVHLWDPNTGQLLQRLKSDMSFFDRQMAFRPDSKMIVTAGRDKVHLWDPNTGQLLRTLIK